MKSTTFTPLLLLLFAIQLPHVVRANFPDTIPEKKGVGTIYYSQGGKLKGYILGVNDSTVSVIQKKYWNIGLYSEQKSVPAEQIAVIMKKDRKGISALGGMAIGAGIGAILGLALGLSDCDDPNDDCSFTDKLFSTKSFNTSLKLSALLGGAGAIVGIIAGGKKKKKIHINSSRSNLQNNKNDILYY